MTTTTQTTTQTSTGSNSKSSSNSNIKTCGFTKHGLDIVFRHQPTKTQKVCKGCGRAIYNLISSFCCTTCIIEWELWEQNLTDDERTALYNAGHRAAPRGGILDVEREVVDEKTGQLKKDEKGCYVKMRVIRIKKLDPLQPEYVLIAV